MTGFLNSSTETLVVLIYLAAISIISVIACAVDKSNARRKKSRVSEKTLFALSVCGGALAMYITMRNIRHKTKHKRFMIGLPIIIFLQAAVILFIILDKAGLLA